MRELRNFDQTSHDRPLLALTAVANNELHAVDVAGVHERLVQRELEVPQAAVDRVKARGSSLSLAGSEVGTPHRQGRGEVRSQVIFSDDV